MAENTLVREYWEAAACGTSTEIVGSRPKLSGEWFEQVERHRYAAEPFVHSVAQFTRYHKKNVLEVGVGAGTDHLQWARAGANCYGVDLTDEAIRVTRAHLALHGFQSNLQRVDAQRLPFADEMFDVVYSWGVIHHAEQPDQVIAEIRRVLKPGGQFLGMLYSRYSATSLRLWVRFALLAGKPWRSPTDVICHHVQNVGAKAYTIRELRAMFSRFSSVQTEKLLTPYDKRRWPRWAARCFPNAWGWFTAVRATK
jgi:SAM-dependent methyltransferase